MKKILLSAAALALLATSCKKDDDNTPSNGWILNGTQYNTAVSTFNSNILAASSSTPSGTFAAYFAGTPGAGTYKIVDSSPATNEVALVAISGTTGYTSSRYSTGNATVSVNGSKITINFPDTWVKTSAGTDSVKLSGNVTQL